MQALLEELKEVDDWYLFGAYLGVPVYKLNEIQSEHRGVERCKLHMLQHWLSTTTTASWSNTVNALELMDKLIMAGKLKQKYLWSKTPGMCIIKMMYDIQVVHVHFTASAESFTASTDSDCKPASPTALSTAEVEADVKVVRGIQDLECSFSSMLLDIKDNLVNCDISRMQFFLNDLFDTDEFSSCDTVDKLLRQLRQGHVDTFNIYYLQQLISRFHQSEDMVKSVKDYKEKIEIFFEATTVKEFLQAIVSKADTLPPKGMAELLIRIPSMCKIKNLRTLKDVEELAKRSFPGCEKFFTSIKVRPGSIIISWYVPESLCEELERLARENAAVLREEGVEEVTIVGEKRVFFSTQEDWLKVSTQMIIMITLNTLCIAGKYSTTKR